MQSFLTLILAAALALLAGCGQIHATRTGSGFSMLEEGTELEASVAVYDAEIELLPCDASRRPEP